MFLRLCLAVVIGFFSGTANALKIEINRGNVQPDPIAVVDFFDSNGNYSDAGSEISKVVKNDLELSGNFVPIDKSMFIESPQTLALQGHNIKNWNVLKARFLVYGIISKGAFNFTVNMKLIDVITGEEMLSINVEGNVNNLRRVAHTIANYIYERVTNEEGYFLINILATKSVNSGVKRMTDIVVCDHDGQNLKHVTKNMGLVVMARYLRDGKSVSFIFYDEKGKGAVGKSVNAVVMDIETKRKRPLINETLMRQLVKKNNGNPIQMTYAARFSNDGTKAVLAIIIKGKSAIYLLDLATNNLTQLTEHNCIDTSPCFSNDGSKIVFTSNRAGREAIYIMNTDGSEQTKISKGEGKYSQPVYSPRGDLITFVKQSGGRFYIGLMKPDGSAERFIACDYLAESPEFIRGGRHIMFASQGGPRDRSVIKIVTIDGHYTRLLDIDGDLHYPSPSH